MADLGEWLGIGGAAHDGWGTAPIEVRVSTGGIGWQWMTLPADQKERLLKFINAAPEVRDRLMRDAKPAPAI